MRDSLTVLAILLICLLTAALVAPYFVDWAAHRGFIEAKLSAAAGTRITIAGPITIRLLPQPTFRLAQVTIGDPAPGQPNLTADELDVDVALTALMRGDLQVDKAMLRRPRLDLAAASDGALRMRIPGFGDPKRVEFQHIEVEDGLFTLTQPGQPILTLSGLNVSAEATSLLGPFKATGRFGTADDPHRFRLSTGLFEGGRGRVKLSLDPTPSLPAIDIDGTASAGGGTPASPVGPSLAALVTLKGEVPLPDDPSTIPWVLTGQVEAAGDRASAADIEVRAGADLRAVNATGTGELVLGAEPHAALRLHGPQIDLDRVAVAPDGSGAEAPGGLTLLSDLNQRLGQSGIPGLSMRLSLDYAFDTLAIGSLTVLGVAGSVGLDGSGAATVRLGAQGPEASRVAFDGRFEGGTAPVFRGHLTSEVKNLPRLADWLSPLMPDLATAATTMIPAQAVSFEGDVDLSGVGLAARKARLRLDTTELTGTLSYTRAVGGDRPRVFADLTSDALDIDDLPKIGLGAANDLDLDLALSARAVKIVPAGIGAIDAGHLDLRLHRSVDGAVLDDLSADLGSARVRATGHLNDRTAALDAHVDAPDLGVVAGLLTQVLPGSSASWLKTRAPALSPAHMDIGLKAARAPDGALQPVGLTLDATLNGSHVKAGLAPDTPGQPDPETALFSVGLEAEAPQGSTLLRQLGLSSAAATSNPPPLGTGRLKGKAHGSAANGFEASLDASLGGAVLSFQGRAKSGHGGGHLSLRGNDLGPLMRSGGLAVAAGASPTQAEAELTWHDGTVALRHLAGTFGAVGFGGDVDAALTSPPAAEPERPTLFGALTIDRLTAPALFAVALGSPPAGDTVPWSDRPFGPAPMPWPRTEVTVRSRSFVLQDGIEARDVSFVLRAARGATTLADVTGKLQSGTFGGSLTLRRDGPAAAVSGTASWSGIPLGWPGLGGRLGGALDFGGSGDTPAALVASLAGTGSMSLADGRMARSDPTALARTVRAAERDTSGIDAEDLEARIGPELDRGPLRLGDVSAQATLAAGTMRLGPMNASSGDWTAQADAALDLKSFTFTAKTVLRDRQPSPDWNGEAPQLTVLLDGPVTAPRRDIDAAAFVNALQSRAIARDQERIDIFQQDVHERAFFNRRLKAIEAEQAAARAKVQAASEAAAGADEVLRQMRQNQEGARPSPPLRPTVLPGARAPLSNPRAGRSPGPKATPAPGLQVAPDPLSAGPF